MSYFDAEDRAELKRAFGGAVLDWPDVTARTMFGCPSYLADGTLFAVLVTRGVALTRLPAERRERLDAEFETGPFEAGSRTGHVVPEERPAAVTSALVEFLGS